MNMVFIRLLFYIFALTFIIESILCTKYLNDPDAVLISNDYVTCYSDRLVIHSYYFPFGDKTIEYSDIRSCELLRSKDLNFFETKTWGMAFSSIWWPLDVHRAWRKYYIVLDVRQWPKIGITMKDKDALKVYNLIKTKMVSTSSKKNSNVDDDEESS